MLPTLPRPVVFAHRGASARAPENTLAAFELALAEGADAIELDAKLTADGHVVVFHDPTLERTTNGTGQLAPRTLEQLRALDAGSSFSERFRGEKIPLLEEVFDAVGKKLFINVELTNYRTPFDDLVRQVCELVKKCRLEEYVIFSSFLPGNLTKARQILPDVPRGLLAPKHLLGAWARSFGFAFGDYAALHPYVTDVEFAYRAARAPAETPHSRVDGQPGRGYGTPQNLGCRRDHYEGSGACVASAGEAGVTPYEWIEQAQGRIAAHIEKTPLTSDDRRGLYLKWENRQVTGSFKPRGALNKVLTLQDWERRSGLVAASAGNHGQGVALAGQITGAGVEVFVSEHAVPAKIQAMRELGATIHTVQGGYAEAELAGRHYAEEHRRVFVSPYNDGQVIAGQGTIGLEIVHDLAGMQAANWIVPAGGGGLISATGTLFARMKHCPRLIGVQAAASPFTDSLYHRHTQEGIQDLPTLADGLSGPVESGSVTIPMMERYVDDFLTVSEEEIARAVAFAWYVYHEKIEGSAAVALAAALGGKVVERPSVLILTGGNIQPEVHRNIIEKYAGERWD